MAIGEAIAGAIEGLFNGGINLYNSQRDFDYQKRVQQEVWNREDNAVQRRMRDLEAAGLNPNLAAGSAASAGAVVGRSNTPNQNISAVGNALDFATHVQQLRNEREQNKILKNQEKLTGANAALANNEALLDNLELNTLLGLKSYVKYNDKGEMYVQHSGIDNIKHMTRENSPLMNYLYWQFQNNKNSADLLQKNVDWYTTDKIADYVATAGGLFSHAGSGLSGIGSFYKNKSYRR